MVGGIKTLLFDNEKTGGSMFAGTVESILVSQVDGTALVLWATNHAILCVAEGPTNYYNMLIKSPSG